MSCQDRNQEVERTQTLEALVRDAYLALLVLRTMCRKAGLDGGESAAAEQIKRMTDAMPELPALSALRGRQDG